MTHHLCHLASFVIVFALCLSGASGQETDRTPIQKHAESLAAITSISADVEMAGVLMITKVAENKSEARPPTKQQMAKFWKSGDRIRIDEIESLLGARTIQINLRDQKVSVANKGGSGQKAWGTAAPINSGAADTLFDVWREAVCLPVNVGEFPRSHTTLDQALADPRCKLKRISRETLDGRACDRVTFENSSLHKTYDVWLDASVNYLARKVITLWNEEGGGWIKKEVVIETFVEPAPGVFFPTQISCKMTGNGSFVGEWPKTTVHVKNLQVNKAIPSDTFEPRFAPGSVLADRFQGKTFTVSASGQPDTPLGTIVPPDESSKPAAGVPTAPTPPGADVPAWALWKILVVVSVLLGLTALAVRLISRWRNRSSDS